MKTQTNSLFTAVSNPVMVQMSAEAKESLAMGFNQPAIKVFSAADMWNIERRKKTRSQRRYF